MTHDHARQARDRQRREAAALGVDELYVSAMVDGFYTGVRADPVLGPLFDARIADWPPHLAQMKLFWRSVLFGSGEYNGRPMVKHVAIAELDRAMFVRWLDLFGRTLDALGPPAAREHVHVRARMIANSLLNGIVVHREGRLGLTPDEALA